MWTRLASLAALLATHVLPAQGWSALVDCGDATMPTISGARTWNHLDPNVTSLALVDDAGAPSGATLTVVRPFSAANSLGPLTAAAGSALAARGYPNTAIGDCLFAGALQTPVRIEVTNLDANALYDLTLFGGRRGASDRRDTRYWATGFQTAGGVLAATNNDRDVLTLTDLLPDGNGTLALDLSPALTNTATNGWFYLNTLQLDERPQGAAPAVLGFARGHLSISRDQGQGPFATTLDLRASVGTPTVNLSVTYGSGASGWLSVPGTAAAGSAIPATTMTATLAVGHYDARIVIQSPGYVTAVLEVQLDILSPDVLHVLQYGNSYTIFNGGQPRLLAAMGAELAGRDVRITPKLAGGTRLAFHLNDPGQTAAIANGLPLGQEWDYVVMQGFSLEATTPFGNRVGFLSDALGIQTNVRNHSPSAVAVMFQTWARARGSSLYSASYPNPAAMHHEVRAAYTEAVARAETAFGPGSARRAAVGDAVALAGWDPALYTLDLSHPTPMLSVLTAMVIHSTLHGRRICDTVPDFAASSPLVVILTNLGLNQADWEAMARLADRVGDFPLRPQVGSSDDLWLRTAVQGAWMTCGSGELRSGDTLAFDLVSPGGAYQGAWGVIGMDLDAVGAPMRSFPAIPEIRLNPTAVLELGSGALGAAGRSVSLVVPPTASYLGLRALAQGLVLAPSAVSGPGRAVTATDGVELVFR